MRRELLLALVCLAHVACAVNMDRVGAVALASLAFVVAVISSFVIGVVISVGIRAYKENKKRKDNANKT